MPEYGDPLTEREKEILCMVTTGITNREIAYKLSISVNTVKVHLRNTFAKLGAESRTEATMIAVREGWVAVPETDEGRETSASSQPPPVAPEPPLPWPRRAALFAALLLVVAGVAVTWPQSEAEGGDETSLPLDQSSEQAPPPATELAESSWHERARMPTRRAYLALAAAGERIYAIAGQTPDGVTDAVEVYGPDDDLWTRGSDKPTPATYVSAGVLGTEIYVPGGCDAEGKATRTVEIYDILTDSWREGRKLSAPRCAYALAARGEELYLFGGWDGEQYVATTYIYDHRSDTWSEGPPMGAGRGFAAAAFLGGRLYVVGGYDGEREQSTCAAYDPDGKIWETCAPLAVGRGGLGLVSLGGQLYAIGGGGWTSYLGFSERYNPNEDVWKLAETPLVGKWRSPGAVAYQNSIFAIGGWSNDYLSLNQVYEALPFRIFIPVGQQQ